MPENYMISRFLHLTKELEKIPVITRGYHMGNRIYRMYSGKTIHKYYESSRNGIKAAGLYNKRSQMMKQKENLIQEFNGDIKAAASDYINTRYAGSLLNEAFYKNAVPNSSPFENKKDYHLNGINYKSRGELMVAQVLTDMGLEFKYEVAIVCGKIEYTADFLVYLPEFGRCFIIEYLGRMDDEDYILKNSVKIRNYMVKGLYFGRDMVLICGSLNGTPTDDQIRAAICRTLYHISSTHLISRANSIYQ